MRLTHALAVLALSALPALGTTEASPSGTLLPWEIDKSHAHITFTADHLGFSMVHGQFRSFDAEVMFDPAAIEATQLSVTIDAASIDTFWEARDRHVRSADFLNVEAHPTITFVSTSVRQTSETTAEITGDLTMIGVTRPVTFEATLNRLAPNPFTGEPTAGLTAVGEIVRADFGMTFGGNAFAAVVPVRIDLEMTPK